MYKHIGLFMPFPSK